MNGKNDRGNLINSKSEVWALIWFRYRPKFDTLAFYGLQRTLTVPKRIRIAFRIFEFVVFNLYTQQKLNYIEFKLSPIVVKVSG